jgi:hypothetical protein
VGEAEVEEGQEGREGAGKAAVMRWWIPHPMKLR